MSMDEDIMYDEPYGESSDSIIRAKWVIDGANTLSEAAEMLRSYADWLEAKEYEGWRLRNVVEDDYGFLYKIDEDGHEIANAELE